MSLIDLDQPADRPTAAPLRWRITAVAVVALLAGAAAGAVTAHRWTVEQQQSADERKVSVLVFADQPPTTSPVGIITNGAGTVQMTFSERIAVVNAGPRPVEVESLTAEKPGVLVTGTARSQWIAPGTAAQVTVGITANCVARRFAGEGTLQATASLRTSTGTTATVATLNLDTAPWTPQFRTANQECLHPHG